MVINTDPLDFLSQGSLTLKGEFLWGSNYTFLVDVEFNDQVLQGVYKPTRGERPLWDFPTASLARREVAAYLVSEALEWRLVPPTVYRSKGPIGAGSLQLFIDHDPEYHYFTFSEADKQRLRPVVLFDLLINNADRKGSHVLLDPDNHLWLIDHGVCFHVEDKLRTVIWDFANETIPGNLCQDLLNLRKALDFSIEIPALVAQLRKYLSIGEIRMLARRAGTLVDMNTFPTPNQYRRPYPWPQL
jgi:uncharacterized repeat protein (TIGR03843 family)